MYLEILKRKSLFPSTKYLLVRGKKRKRIVRKVYSCKKSQVRFAFVNHKFKAGVASLKLATKVHVRHDKSLSLFSLLPARNRNKLNQLFMMVMLDKHGVIITWAIHALIIHPNYFGFLINFLLHKPTNLSKLLLTYIYL